VVREITIKMGDKVSKGSPILELEAKDEAARPQPRPEPKKEAKQEPRPPPKPTGDGSSTTVPVPDIGDFKEVEVIEVLVKPGDAVAKEQSLITLESDKATMEIPSPSAGVVRELKIKVGDKVSKGSPILVLSANRGRRSGRRRECAFSRAPHPRKRLPGRRQARRRRRQHRRRARCRGSLRKNSAPSLTPALRVRKFARELGVDLQQVQGSGPKGRILHTDVQAFVKGALTRTPTPVTAKAAARCRSICRWPEVDFAKFGPVETKPLSRIQKLSGPYLHRNWISIPHVTQFDEADITDLEAFRKAQTAETEKKGFKLTMLAFMIKACVTALRQFPVFNSSLDKSGENIIIKKYYHVGVAVDTPGGLVVPVVRDADRKGVFDLAHELADISKLARDGKLKPGDMQGGTFSISSLGGISGTAFTPIINAPEVAILGFPVLF
jgi:pyruvate dehydrogenase E2 component (dihydrolipoamide acetyltransferase)